MKQGDQTVLLIAGAAAVWFFFIRDTEPPLVAQTLPAQVPGNGAAAKVVEQVRQAGQTSSSPAYLQIASAIRESAYGTASGSGVAPTSQTRPVSGRSRVGTPPPESYLSANCATVESAFGPRLVCA